MQAMHPKPYTINPKPSDPTLRAHCWSCQEEVEAHLNDLTTAVIGDAGRWGAGSDMKGLYWAYIGVTILVIY